jgi:uncharacterized RDD family membrane protein YckC
MILLTAMELTYKIIGGDGIEYGPVPMDELKRWITDGRVAPTTQVWRSDVGRWGLASGYAELESELGQVAQAVAPPLQPVGFWPRVGAFLIDTIVLQGIFFTIWGSEPQNVPRITPASDLQAMLAQFETMLVQLAPQLICRFLIQMGYSVLFNGQFGATLGKLAIGARIVNGDGSRIGFGKALLRFLATMVSQFTLGIGYVMVAVRADKRALHDLLANTRVIYRRSDPSLQ